MIATKLAASLLSLGLVAYGSVEVWLSKLSYDQPAKRRYCAAWLCPEEFWETRTFTLLQKSAAGGANAVIGDFQRAAKTDGASAYNWANLAEVERDAGRMDLAKYCFQRALEAGPGNPAILFRAANFDFETADTSAALRNLSAILRNPELTNYYEPAFLTCSRLGLPIEDVLAKGIPQTGTAAEAFLQFWMDDNKVGEAEATWHWMTAHALTSEKSCASYTEFLIRNHQVELANKEWKRLNQPAQSNYQVFNWLFNAGFEEDPQAGPFDWHIDSAPGVEASRVEDMSRDGQWSLRLVFDGKENVDYHDVYQEALVKPGQWRLRGFVKLDDVTTDQGIALRAYDVDLPARLDVKTETQTGTAGWKELEETFTVTSETKLLRIEIMRPASQELDGKISGRAWVDSLDLSPVR